MSCTIKEERCGGLCTGYDGSKIWDERKKINDKIECESCKIEARKLENMRNPDIIVDSVLNIIGESSSFTNNFLIDELYLKSKGINDFSKYQRELY